MKLYKFGEHLSVMKNVWKIILVLFLIVFTLGFAVSCGSAESISVSESARGQTTYVVGQELNLSGGVLIVNNGKGTEEIPLDSKGVKVSGYEKNTLGVQTLTVEYGGATTELIVNVVERVAVSGVKADYLVGDSFDASKGSVTVTDDKGSSRVLRLSNDAVKIEGFNSSSESMGASVKVICTVGGESYEGSFNVNVYGIETVDFKRPNKITYGSHYEGGPDATGGYFTLKGNGGNLTRTVNITSDMISGLDVSTVDAENREDTQLLTVTYGSKSYTYEVKVTYTDISLFRDNAAAFNVIDWAGESEPTIDRELGELAMSLMEIYIEMEDADRSLIDDTDAFNVARTAMVYGFEVWAENIRLFKGAFAIEYGEIVLYCESYDSVKGAVELFKDKDSPIYTVSPLLLSLIEMYGDRVIYENETTRISFNTYPVLDEYALNFMAAMFENTIEVYDRISKIPYGWAADDLNAYRTDIEAAYVKILTDNSTAYFPSLYYFVSDWREDGALFDIIYTYFYNTNRLDYVIALAPYGLPSEIRELYSYISSAVIAMGSIERLELTDTTKFFYNYHVACERAEKVKAKSGSVELYIYENLPLNSLMGSSSNQRISFEDLFDYARTSSCGYYDLSAGLLGTPEYDAFMAEYMALVGNILEIPDYDGTEAYAECVASLFNRFAAFSPSQQYSLISSLNSLYSLGIPELAFDDTEENIENGSICLFAIILNTFMREQFTEEYSYVYDELILAIEVYANRFGYPEWEEDFTARMNRVAAALTVMGDENGAKFEKYLGTAYKKYKEINNTLGNTTDLGEWGAELERLSDALINLQTAHYFITEGGLSNYNYFLASYERALHVAENIIKNAPDSVVLAYYREALFEAYPATDTEAATYWTYDYAMTVFANFYVDHLVFFGSAKTNIYDTYVDLNLSDFLDCYYSMVIPFLNKSEGEADVFDRAEVLIVLDKFCRLPSDAKALFTVMEGGVDIYYTALAAFIKEEFTDGAGELATKLFVLEKHYYTYEMAPNDVTLKSIEATLKQVKEMHEALSELDAESFDALNGIYTYYVALCEKLFV